MRDIQKNEYRIVEERLEQKSEKKKELKNKYGYERRLRGHPLTSTQTK